MIEENLASASAEEFQALQDNYGDGKIQVVISRSIARHFYLVTSLADIKNRTGRSEVAAKLSVYAGLVLSPFLGAIGLLLLIYYDGWWATVNIPIAGILWTVIAGFLNPTGPWWTMTLALLAALAIYLLDLLPISIALPFLFWTVSLWINRMTYVVAGSFLTRLVVSSRDAFEMLHDHIEIREETIPLS